MKTLILLLPFLFSTSSFAQSTCTDFSGFFQDLEFSKPEMSRYIQTGCTELTVQECTSLTSNPPECKTIAHVKLDGKFYAPTGDTVTECDPTKVEDCGNFAVSGKDLELHDGGYIIDSQHGRCPATKTIMSLDEHRDIVTRMHVACKDGHTDVVVSTLTRF